MNVVLLCVVGVVLLACGCKKYKLEHVVDRFAGTYRISGNQSFYGILSQPDTLPGGITARYIDTTFITQTYNDSVINVSVTNDTALVIWGEQCYYNGSSGVPYIFTGVDNSLYWQQNVTFYQANPDSVVITIWQHLNPADHLQTVLSGRKL